MTAKTKSPKKDNFFSDTINSTKSLLIDFRNFAFAGFSPTQIVRNLMGLTILVVFFSVVLGYSFDHKSELTSFFYSFFKTIYYFSGFMVVLKILQVVFRKKLNLSKNSVAVLNLLTLSLVFLSFLGIGLSFYHTQRYYRLFVVPKIILLYPGASILLGLTTITLIFEKKIRKSVIRTSLFIIIGFYALWLLVNIFVSTMPLVTFFGSVVRQMGVISIWSMLIMAVATALWLRGDKKRFKILFHFVLFVGLLLSLRAFYEMTRTDVNSYRPSGFAGNPDYYANNLVFTVLFSLFAFLQSRRNKLESIWTGLVFMASFYALVLSRTRGAWLGLGFASTIGMLVFNPSHFLKIREIRFKLVSILAMVLAGFIMYYFYIGSVLPPDGIKAGLINSAQQVVARRVTNSIFVLMTIAPILARLLWNSFAKIKLRLSVFGSLMLISSLFLVIPQTRKPIFVLVDKALHVRKIFRPKHGEPRLKLWEDTLPMIADHWFLGVGRETYRVNFLQYKTFDLAYRDPGVNYRSSHNMFVDQVVMEGFPGIIFFLLIMGIGIWLIFVRNRKDKEDAQTGLLLTGVGLAVFGYIGHSITIYDVLPSSAYIYLSLGMALGMAAPRLVKLGNKNLKKSQNPKRWNLKYLQKAIAAGVVIAIITVPAVYYVSRHHYADKYLSQLSYASGALKQFRNSLGNKYKVEQKMKSARTASTVMLKSNPPERHLNQIAKNFKIPRKNLNNPKLRRRYANSIRNKIKKQQHLVDNVIIPNIKKVVKYAKKVKYYDPGLGYHPYMVGHLGQVLMQYQSYGIGMTGDKLHEFLLDASRRGVHNNTNPESAYSRLASGYYAVATFHFNQQNYKKAWENYQKALEAVQGSINHDRVYYDTHRIKSLFLLRKFCEIEKSEKELNKAKDILINSIMSRYHKILQTYSPMYFKIAVAYFERAQSGDNQKKVVDYKKVVRVLGTISQVEQFLNRKKIKNNRKKIEKINEQLSKLKNRLKALKSGAGGKNPANYLSQINRLESKEQELQKELAEKTKKDESLSRRMKLIEKTATRTDKMKTGLNQLAKEEKPDSRDLVTYKKKIEKLFQVFPGKKSSSIYSTCRKNLELMKGAAK
ncbi:MAG: O-antigen ligase family protein [Myxococcota bacterium]